jgi:hypothetical protein
LFPEQSAAGLSEAVRRFEDTAHNLRSQDMLDNAQQFNKARFTKSFQKLVG